MALVPMKSDHAIEKIDNQYDEILVKDKVIADQLCLPIKAIKSGYHEKPLFLCGNILRYILKEICQIETDDKEIKNRNVRELYESVQDRIEDRLIAGYFTEIVDSTEKADSGEHLKI